MSRKIDFDFDDDAPKPPKPEPVRTSWPAPSPRSRPAIPSCSTGAIFERADGVKQWLKDAVVTSRALSTSTSLTYDKLDAIAKAADFFKAEQAASNVNKAPKTGGPGLELRRRRYADLVHTLGQSYSAISLIPGSGRNAAVDIPVGYLRFEEKLGGIRGIDFITEEFVNLRLPPLLEVPCKIEALTSAGVWVCDGMLASYVALEKEEHRARIRGGGRIAVIGQITKYSW